MRCNKNLETRRGKQTPQRTVSRNPVVSNRVPLEIALPREESRRKAPKERPNRRATASRGTPAKQRPMSANNIMPKNRNDIIKGIVFSEIFGPPISKR